MQLKVNKKMKNRKHKQRNNKDAIKTNKKVKI